VDRQQAHEQRIHNASALPGADTCFSVLSLAEDVVTEGLDPAPTKVCDRSLSPEDNAKTSVQAGGNTPDEGCVQPAPEVIDLARQEITAEITENTQSVF
jgi:hypothetical protein